MEVFAVRHKPTGKWMPNRMFRTSLRGGSYWNPTSTAEIDRPYDTNPRLFFSLQGARNALTMWLQGEWRNTQTQGTYFEPPEDAGPAPFNPPTPRKREDMEIVTLTLSGL